MLSIAAEGTELFPDMLVFYGKKFTFQYLF